MNAFPFLSLAPGIEIRENRYLGPPPRLEPETFSGGVNLSARERNAARIKDAARVYGLASMPGLIFCSPWVASLIRKQVSK